MGSEMCIRDRATARFFGSPSRFSAVAIFVALASKSQEPTWLSACRASSAGLAMSSGDHHPPRVPRDLLLTRQRQHAAAQRSIRSTLWGSPFRHAVPPQQRFSRPRMPPPLVCPGRGTEWPTRTDRRFAGQRYAPWTSQCGQDAYLDAVYFQGSNQGLFLDIGCNDGKSNSNSTCRSFLRSACLHA